VHQAAGMTHDVIGAIEAHNEKGPGSWESIDEGCLSGEPQLRGRQVQNQDRVVIRYKRFRRGEPLRWDLPFDPCLCVEVNAASKG